MEIVVFDNQNQNQFMENIMNLNSYKVGDQVILVAIHENKELKQRLNSFGVRKGSVMQIKAISLAKQTLQVSVSGFSLALRAEEAKYIEVEDVK
jgi:ferrous iron transport protein A